VVASILREIAPPSRTAPSDGSRPLTAAVLVRKNAEGKTLVDYLRRECPGMTIIHEGRAAIKDNPVVAVLLSLIAFGAHPGNTLAWRHLEMSPLNDAVHARGLSQDTLSRTLLRQVQAHGFHSLLRDWGGRLDAACPLDDYGRKRLGELLAAATEFDSAGSRDCDEFLDFIDSYELHEQAADDAIRVMTVHQAKGLEFDIVILPELDDGDMAASRDTDFALARDPKTNEPLWALELPRKAVVEADETLAAQLATAREDAALESLCLLYVAMTRARHALYIVTSYPGKSSSAFSQPALLKKQLAASDERPFTIGGGTYSCLFETGKVDWYAALPGRAATPTREEEAADTEQRPRARRRLIPLRPSDADEMETAAAALFDEGRRRRRELGTAVHALLQHVEWLDGADADDVLETTPLPPETDPALREQALAHARAALRTGAVAKVFRRPAGEVSLWRERRFEVVRGDDWITGTFDRVAVHRNNGRVTSAAIYDFKTDNVADRAAVRARADHYAPQMRAYRDVLSRMLGLPSKAISLELVFTAAGVVHPVD
jgi:ATP-dependent helicase/nuclease subunit A